MDYNRQNIDKSFRETAPTFSNSYESDHSSKQRLNLTDMDYFKQRPNIQENMKELSVPSSKMITESQPVLEKRNDYYGRQDIYLHANYDSVGATIQKKKFDLDIGKESTRKNSPFSSLERNFSLTGINERPYRHQGPVFEHYVCFSSGVIFGRLHGGLDVEIA